MNEDKINASCKAKAIYAVINIFLLEKNESYEFFQVI